MHGPICSRSRDPFAAAEIPREARTLPTDMDASLRNIRVPALPRDPAACYYQVTHEYSNEDKRVSDCSPTILYQYCSAQQCYYLTSRLVNYGRTNNEQPKPVSHYNNYGMS